MTTNEVILTISEDHRESFKRLDQFLTKHVPNLSRTVIKSLFKKEMITSDSTQKLELKRMPDVGTIITVTIPLVEECSIDAEDIPLDILFEDEHLIIINKKAGMVIHPAPGHQSGTLVNAILHHCKDLTGVGDERRPGIVHRLDKGTSGVMVVAKNHQCHQGLIDLFSKHDIKREYVAIAMKEHLPAGGTITSTIGRHPKHRLRMAINVKDGKDAKTFYFTLESFSRCTYLKCRLETGRTHQIRVHLGQVLKAPILNDPLYASPKDQFNILPTEVTSIIGDYPHPFLHAKVLGFVHPITKEELLFEQGPPELFLKVLEQLRALK